MFYFAFSSADPIPSYIGENKTTIEEMRKRFIGTFVRTGDEDHDFDRVADIWTESQVKAYFEEV